MSQREADALRRVDLLRELAPQVLGVVVRRFGDFEAAEDAVQEALLAAATRWPTSGVPDNPRAWLIDVAGKRMTDHVRAEIARRRRETKLVNEMPDDEQFVPPPDARERDGASATDAGADDTLLLLFMCCHPSLTRTSAIALTLRAVGGLTTAEIAHAFLVPEATMAQRISRAKQLIKKSGVGFRMPTDAELAERLGSVLHVLYLVFNEGYATSEGTELARVDLSSEAIRLARAVHHLRPHDGEVAGLLALMLLTDARRPARTGPSGEIVPLDEQDRTRWDRAMIDEGIALVSGALARGALARGGLDGGGLDGGGLDGGGLDGGGLDGGAVGPYQIQAAIAAVHDEAKTAMETNWPQILALYDVLEQMTDNPMVTLNRAIAVAMVDGPARGLEVLAPLDADPRIANHHRLSAVRAHFHERLGARDSAISEYRSAAARTASIPERNYLLMKAARLAE